MIDAPPSMPPQQVIAQKLVACGLDRGSFSVTWQGELQSIEIVIKRDAHASAGQFPCIHEAAATEIIRFDDQSLQSAYSDFEVELYRPRMIADAKAAVTKLGLIEGFPKRSEHVDLRDYLVALERHCGYAAGSVLRVSGDTVTFIPPPEPNPLTFTQRYEKIFAALGYAMAIGDLKSFGFIGNEAVASRGK